MEPRRPGTRSDEHNAARRYGRTRSAREEEAQRRWAAQANRADRSCRRAKRMRAERSRRASRRQRADVHTRADESCSLSAYTGSISAFWGRKRVRMLRIVAHDIPRGVLFAGGDRRALTNDGGATLLPRGMPDQVPRHADRQDERGDATGGQAVSCCVVEESNHDISLLQKNGAVRECRRLPRSMPAFCPRSIDESRQAGFPARDNSSLRWRFHWTPTWPHGSSSTACGGPSRAFGRGRPPAAA